MRDTPTVTNTVDWKLLRDKAIQAARGAYAPYSRFPVGAAALVDDGRIITGCGRCRQVLLEHGGPDLLIDHQDAPRRLGDLLPEPFGPDDLT